MIPKIQMEISKYEGLVTVFALMLAVEYASATYDLWDIFIGTLSIYLGTAYWKQAIENNDFLYSALTVSLISLGIVTIISFIFYTVDLFTSYFSSMEKVKFWAENIKFTVFIAISFGLYMWLNRKISHDNSMQPTAEASAD